MISDTFTEIGIIDANVRQDYNNDDTFAIITD